MSCNQILLKHATTQFHHFPDPAEIKSIVYLFQFVNTT
ncbi:hypothetical protein KSS87_018378 [Heliosperma pusillum]|nr:hypothetical protein KSS87_018378 [Heliosperma pusillum]